ncbi:MAG: response regulator [Bdellovibrionia bacterium]
MSERDNILIIEDSETQGLFLQLTLQKAGLKSYCALTGEAGLQSLEGETLPDLIILDYYLPGMRGDEVCRSIRSNIRTKTIPIILLTSQEESNSNIPIDSSGVSCYIPKPIDPEALVTEVEKLLGRTQSPLPASTLPLERTYRRAKILAVDDSPTYLEFLSGMLAEEGYAVSKCANGHDALARLDKETFQCILVDLVMPVLDGVEVCKMIIEHQKHIENPVVLLLLTAHENKDEMARALAAGADDFVAKTSDSSVLKARIKALLRRKFLQEEEANKRIVEEQKNKELEALRSRAQQEIAEAKTSHMEELQKTADDLKAANEELGRAKETALQATLAKSQFLATMSHEIRTPMNSIIGMADLLSESALSIEQKRYVDSLSSSSLSLLSLLNDILDLSKIEAGHLELERIDFDLNDVLAKVADVTAQRAHEKGIKLVLHISPGVPTNLVGDPNRLRQVLVNLVGNSIKFTEKGEVILTIKCDPTTNIPGKYIRLQFSVTDTGIGMTPEQSARLFKPYAQADTSIATKYGGTGLGLNICRQLVEKMQGKIDVESTREGGSKFFFDAEFKISTLNYQQAELETSNLSGKKILIVDNNPTSRMILTEHFTTWGARPTEAANGEIGLQEITQAIQAGDPFNLILVDYSMVNGMDGLEFLTKTKGLPTPALLMITLSDQKSDAIRAWQPGINSFLLKPIKMQELLKGVNSALNVGHALPQGSAPEARPTAHGDKRPLKILLVDDNEENRFLIVAFLKNTPYKIDFAENGEIAVKSFKQEKYDLVLMDMQMPVMDGYEATQLMRKWESTNNRKKTPIVALTANALLEEKQLSLSAGCDAHVTKPIRKTALLQTISEHTQFASS